MEEKNGDNGKRRESERLATQQNKIYTRRPLSNRTSDNYQINNNHNRRSVTVSIIDDNSQYQPVSRRSERIQSPMNSLPLSQYNSNPSLIEQQEQTHLHHSQQQQSLPQKTSNDEETYSFRHVTKKLQHAKSHGELYQPIAPLPMPPITKISNDENEIKYPQKHSSESPQSSISPRIRAATTTAVPILSRPTVNLGDETINSSSSNKIPLWKRFKKMIVPSKRSKENSSSKVPTLQFNELSTNEINRTVPDGVVNTSNNLLQNPIKLNDLRTWLIPKTFPEQRIRDEYEKLSTEPLHPRTFALRPENKSKNRFNAIEPYDHSRVVLKSLPNDPTTDYINASYIDGDRMNKLYIAAQAPTDTTLYDFIRMIWQLRIQSIVMVTRLFEDGKHKCIQYWPDEGEKRINDFKIRIDSEEKYADYTIRKLIIYNQLEPSDMLIVKQYHFLSWPDHGCLSLSTPLLDFRQRFRTDYKPWNPILVHCSAGVGRSGTFIALDALLEKAKHQDTIDILEFTHRMRQNRVYMIQTVDQYVFLYRTLIEGILTMDISLSLQEYLTTRKLYMDIKSQYKLLEQLQSTVEFSYQGAVEPANLNKNRVETILAPDNSRPYLMTQVDKTTDYINAVFVNSYRQTPNYIVTQYPLPHTCIDFWRLVYDHNVSIIMLLESISRDSKNIYYWPTNVGQLICYGPFEIVLMSQKEDEQLIERVFELKFTNKSAFTTDRTRSIRQFQIKDYSHLLLVVKRFLKEMRTFTGQNVILQCLNGATWSGYFAALCNAIDKMQTEQIIDPFKIVRLIRSTRPQFIDQDQYENLYSSMRDYAQQYLSTTPTALAQRSTENPFYTDTSREYQSTTTNRIVQRL
ncbi:unnamed protein product [Rotaria socialis]|uniref:protein-tyrosine-phosphatase n=1 Tax=Rotaria socialis TaxID=392032 RepID=A0A820E9I2_9BILA|nr:unnamed protein product [Rotaria socialis]CAF3749486.1 unnamed protein product [Rotaria socialis]CAF4244912.1 unnamed protein product [Rotaria socialis]CAF4505352.1 unnamed protein product [Rotaria socialis]